MDWLNVRAFRIHGLETSTQAVDAALECAAREKVQNASAACDIAQHRRAVAPRTLLVDSDDVKELGGRREREENVDDHALAEA